MGGSPVVNSIKKEGREIRAHVSEQVEETKVLVAGAERRLKQAVRDAGGSRVVAMIWGVTIFLLGGLAAHLLLP